VPFECNCRACHYLLQHSQSTSKHTAFALRHSFSTRSVACSLGPELLPVLYTSGSPSKSASAADAAALGMRLHLALLLLWAWTAAPRPVAVLLWCGLQTEDR
jgi:hypothetical protein